MKNTQNQQKKYLLAAIALFFIPVSGLSIDIYVPSLPAVSKYFVVDKSLVQLSITFYMAGLGIMQLFAGPLSDSFGRRKPFLISSLLFVLDTLFIPFSPNIYLLLLLRFLQGLFVAIAIVPMRSVIPDLFEGRELYKMVNYMTMVWSLGPIVAPGIGGYLQHYFGWQSNFYFLAAYSFIGFLLALFFMSETSKHHLEFHPVQITNRYQRILFHWHYFFGLMCAGILYSSLVLFGTIAPFLFQNVMHFSAIQFGNIALLMGAAWFTGSMTNRFLINIPVETKTKYCFWSMFFIAIIMVIINYLMPMKSINLILPLIFFLWLAGMNIPNFFARSVSYFPESSGSANSLFGAFIFFIGGLSTAIATTIQSTTSLPLALTYFVLTCILIFFYYIDRLKK